MARRGRPRKWGPRKPSGGLRPEKKKEKKNEGVWTRMRDFGVTAKQSSDPLSGYLAGVLFLRRRIDARAMGGFYSFLQSVPKHSRSIPLKERVQGGHYSRPFSLSDRYVELIKVLKKGINALHALERDQLIVPANTIQALLHKVPLTIAGYRFMKWCEIHHPKKPANKRGQQAKGH